jgi:uncharacterized OsmC-like protein
MQTTTMINGVNVDQLMETIDAIRHNGDISKFEFRSHNQWLGGGHNRTRVDEFTGACETQRRSHPFIIDKDEPPVLLGSDQAANPVEYVLAALAGCLTTSLVYHAAARGIELESVESSYEGDLDLKGFLGLSDEVRNGYEQVRVSFRIKGDASPEQLEELVQLAQQRSPVFDIVSNPVAVQVSLAGA